MITKESPLTREERILHQLKTLDMKPVYSDIFMRRVLEYPHWWRFWLAGGPGGGKTTVGDGIQHTIERLYGVTPRRIYFDDIRRELLDEFSTGGEQINAIKDLTPSQKLKFKQVLTRRLTEHPRKSKKNIFRPTIVEAPSIGDDVLGGENEVERGQTGLKHIARLKDTFVIHLLGNQAVYDRAKQVRSAAQHAPDDYDFKFWLKAHNMYEGEVHKSNIGVSLLREKYLRMGGSNMITDIMKRYDQLAMMTYSQMLNNVSQKLITEMTLDSLDVPDQINGTDLSTEELEIITVRGLYAYILFRQMGYPPTSPFAFVLLNQFSKVDPVSNVDPGE